MIEVWLRHENQSSGRRLCSWPATELDSLLPAIGRWGIYHSGNMYSTGDLVGQINYDETGTYFDIIIIAGGSS